MLMRNQASLHMADEVMMMTPAKKRMLPEHSYLTSLLETPLPNNEIVFPTEMEKLKKLFPLLDPKVTHKAVDDHYSNLKRSSMTMTTSTRERFRRSSSRKDRGKSKRKATFPGTTCNLSQITKSLLQLRLQTESVRRGGEMSSNFLMRRSSRSSLFNFRSLIHHSLILSSEMGLILLRVW